MALGFYYGILTLTLTYPAALNDSTLFTSLVAGLSIAVYSGS